MQQDLQVRCMRPESWGRRHIFQSSKNDIKALQAQCIKLQAGYRCTGGTCLCLTVGLHPVSRPHCLIVTKTGSSPVPSVKSIFRVSSVSLERFWKLTIIGESPWMRVYVCMFIFLIGEEWRQSRMQLAKGPQASACHQIMFWRSSAKAKVQLKVRMPKGSGFCSFH